MVIIIDICRIFLDFTPLTMDHKNADFFQKEWGVPKLHVLIESIVCDGTFPDALIKLSVCSDVLCLLHQGRYRGRPRPVL